MRVLVHVHNSLSLVESIWGGLWERSVNQCPQCNQDYQPTIELILENAQMAISGIYQMEDDGVINPDNVSLVPETVIPKSPGSVGLQPIATAGRFDVADLVLNDMRNNIKRALYNDMLGDPNRTPASATEIAERMADLSRRIGSALVDYKLNL